MLVQTTSTRTLRPTLIAQLIMMLFMLPAVQVASAQAPKESIKQAITNAKLWQSDGTWLSDQTIVIDGTVIVEVGTTDQVAIPDGAEVIDAKGRAVYPGFIDAWTTLGLTEVPSVSSTVDSREMGTWNAHLRAGSAVNPHSAHFPVARVNGLTTAMVVPGGGTLSGEAEVLDLYGRTVPKMRVTTNRPLRVLRLPSPPRRTFDKNADKKWDEKLEKSWKKLEKRFESAKRMGELVKTGIGYPGKKLSGQERLSLLATARHLEAGHPWLVSANRHDEILAALRFAKKHKLPLILAGLNEGYTLAKTLADSPHGLLVGSPFRSPDRDAPYDAGYANAAALHRAGARFGMVSESSSNVRNLPYQAAMAVSFGLPKEVALRALTVEPARILGLAETHGSLEKGKIANIVVWGGDPLDARSNPEYLWIRGQRVPLISRHTYLAEPFMSAPR